MTSSGTAPCAATAARPAGQACRIQALYRRLVADAARSVRVFGFRKRALTKRMHAGLNLIHRGEQHGRADGKYRTSCTTVVRQRLDDDYGLDHEMRQAAIKESYQDEARERRGSLRLAGEWRGAAGSGKMLLLIGGTKNSMYTQSCCDGVLTIGS